jgi:chromosome partitioning protein
MQTMELVRANLNPRLELLGMVMTMFDPRTRLSSQVVDEVRRVFPERTFGTVIPRSVRLSEAPSHGKAVLEYEPTSRGAGAYADLAQELLQRGVLRAARA